VKQTPIQDSTIQNSCRKRFTQ